MAKHKQFSMGIDYGTNSCRALIVDVSNGREIASNTYNYPSGQAGILLDKDPNLARQNPQDYITGFLKVSKQTIKDAKKIKGFDPAYIIGIGVDTTGSTPIPVDKEGIPLAFKPRFKNNLNAQAWLWKDHTSHQEAAKITEMAQKQNLPYLAKCGGTYSSEWFWAKIWHCKNKAPGVFNAAYSWVELCDFIPAYITGNLNPLSLKRSICAAGHKALFSEDWNGLPSKAFLKSLDTDLADLRDRLYSTAYASDQIAGYLTNEIAKKIGLPNNIAVAVGAFDAHHGAVGSGVKKGTLIKVIGTSSCDLLVGAKNTRDIPGVCGVVPGSVLPGLIGIEAGQSAVGDIFNWFVKNFCPPEFCKIDAHISLTKIANKLKPGESGLMCLDWNNGNRTILVDPLLSGCTIGTTLHTTAPEMYRALIEATAFGALTIIKRIQEYDIKIKEIITCGGIAEKNPMVMQIYADICNRPIKISRSSQTCALGAAIFGAVVGNAHKSTAIAQSKMTGVKTKIYKPIKANVKIYKELYAIYQQLHDAFGTKDYSGKLNLAMKDLIAIRNKVRK